MAELTKGQARKLEAFRKSVGGDEQATRAMFDIWMQAQPKKTAVSVDNVAIRLEEVLAPLVNDKSLRLGNHGYTIKRAKGKGASGFVATKND